jgi:hypothetical protein
MAQQVPQRRVISPQDPWRWLTFSSFWGSIYYGLVYAGLIAGHTDPTVRVNRRALMVSLLVYLPVFVSGGTLVSLLQQLVVQRSAKEQSETAIASGVLEPSIPLQALGGAVGSVVPLCLVLASSEVACRLCGEPLMEPAAIRWPRAIAVTGALSGLASLAVSRIAAWVAEDAQHARH